jgi:hypothetical protein
MLSMSLVLIDKRERNRENIGEWECVRIGGKVAAPHVPVPPKLRQHICEKCLYSFIELLGFRQIAKKPHHPFEWRGFAGTGCRQA